MWYRTVVCIVLLFQDMLTKLQVFLLEGASPLSFPSVGKGRYLFCCLILH